jgi:hypothetical protein
MGCWWGGMDYTSTEMVITFNRVKNFNILNASGAVVSLPYKICFSLSVSLDLVPLFRGIVRLDITLNHIPDKGLHFHPFLSFRV